MTRKEQLLEIAKRCKAGEVSRKLDADFSAAIKHVPEDYQQEWVVNWGGEWCGNELGRVTLMHENGDKGPYWSSEPFSKSLDAVKALHDELIPNHNGVSLVQIYDDKWSVTYLGDKIESPNYFCTAPTLELAWLGCICLVLAEKEQSE